MVIGNTKFRPRNPKVVGSNPTPATKENVADSSVGLSAFSLPKGQNVHKLNVHKMFTREMLAAFIKSRANGLSPLTIADYEWRLGRFIGYPLTPDGIKSFLDNLTCTNGKWNYFKSLRALINWLSRNAYIPDNPISLVETPRRQKKILPAVSKGQLDTLIKYCSCERDKVVISFLWYTGVRLNECANVRAKDFNWDEQTVIVLGKGNKYRKALAGNGIIRAWFSNHDSFELNASGIQMMLKRLGKVSGIQCNPHSFRRGFAVNNVKAGLSTRVVQSLGGWEQIQMVERYTKSLTFDDAFTLYKQVNGC